MHYARGDGKSGSLYPGGDAFNLTGVEAGSYYLYFRQGESWNASREGFDINASSSWMREPLLFQTISTADRIQYSWIEITLEEAGDGNVEKVAVDEADFPAQWWPLSL